MSAADPFDGVCTSPGICNCTDRRECGNAEPQEATCGYGGCELPENSCPACQGIV